MNSSKVTVERSKFFNYALKKNSELHKHFATNYKYLGCGKFISAYYDEANDCVYKVFRLKVLNDRYHSLCVCENAPEFFTDIIFPVVNNGNKIISQLKKHIWKTNLDWAEFCLKNCKKNEHLPYVESIEFDSEHFAYIIKTEPLVHANKINMKHIYKFMGNLTDCIHYQREGYSFNAFYSPYHFNMSSDIFKEYIKLIDYKKMKDLSTKMKKKFKDYSLDLHAKNYMFRNSEMPVLVINDPLY
jgi:hypothetical protein